jgi:hypothetical protein
MLLFFTAEDPQACGPGPAAAILESVRQKDSRRTRNRLINHVRTLLLECQHDAAYSATCASVIHGDAEY